MKKTLSFIGMISIVLIVGFAVVSCGGGGSGPADVVKELHTAIEKGNTNKINQLMTAEGAAMMVMFAEKAKGMLAEQGKIVRTEEEINGNNATVTVYYANGDEEEFELVKVDGKWKVTMEK